MQLRVLIGLLLTGSVVCGCSGGAGDRPVTVPAEGQVTLNGKPLANVKVTLMNPNSPRAATGQTDSNGRFELGTFEPGDGAVPGEHQVAIEPVREVKGVVGLESAEYEDAMKQSMQGKTQAEADFPSKYMSFESSELTVTIPDEGEKTIEIRLEK